MISFEEAIQIHTLLIQKFGGTNGIRNSDVLLSALARPFQTFDGIELYPTPVEKAAAILESIISNHPFLDGNKRLGYVLMKLFLLEGGFHLKVEQQDAYQFIILVASGQQNIDRIISWLQSHVRQR